MMPIYRLPPYSNAHCVPSGNSENALPPTSAGIAPVFISSTCRGGTHRIFAIQSNSSPRSQMVLSFQSPSGASSRFRASVEWAFTAGSFTVSGPFETVTFSGCVRSVRFPNLLMDVSRLCSFSCNSASSLATTDQFVRQLCGITCSIVKSDLISMCSLSFVRFSCSIASRIYRSRGCLAFRY